MSKETTKYRRFDHFQRLEHALLIASFTILAITGLPQKYSFSDWGGSMIWLFGGIELTRLIHRTAAIFLMLETIYHVVMVAYKVVVKQVRLTMLPGWQDVKDAVQTLGYNLRISKSAPKMGRYTFGEKVEYWAVIWGTLIMIFTGFMLWNPIATANFFPGQFIPAAKAAHGGEALLAVLSILTWHVYNVHIKHLNRSMFTGYITKHEMEIEHKLELETFQGDFASTLPSPVISHIRQRLFISVATLVGLLLLAGLFYFVTFEQTAITTVPRQNVEVFVPSTPVIQSSP